MRQSVLRYSSVMPDTSSSPPSSVPSSDTVKLRQRERTFPVQHRDWLEIRQKVVSLAEPMPYLASVGWTCVGITISALLVLFAWQFVNTALPSKAQMHYTFITPLLIITAIAGALIVAFTFTVWRQVRIRITTVQTVVDEIDAIYRPHKSQGPRR